MRVMKISEVIGHKVFTDGANAFGEIEEANLTDNKIEGWRIRVNGQVMSLVGGARGVIIPHHFVRAIGDIVLINQSALPSDSGLDEIPEEMI